MALDLKTMGMPKKEVSKTMTPGEFFGYLFKIRDEIHLTHLSTKSYSAHKALNEFYDEILDLTDGIIESYQGKFGIQKITIPTSINADNNGINCIKELAKLTDGGAAYNMFTETWIKNELDTISKLCYEILYKLENLK